MGSYIGTSPAAWDRVSASERDQMRAAFPGTPELTEDEARTGRWSGDRLIVAEVTMVRLQPEEGAVTERSIEICYSVEPDEEDDERQYVAMSDGDSTDFFGESDIGKTYRRLDAPRYEVWICDHEMPHRDRAAPAAPEGKR